MNEKIKSKAKELALTLVGEDQNPEPLVEILMEMAQWMQEQMMKDAASAADETGNIFDNLIDMAENCQAGESKISMDYRGWNCSVEVKKPVSKKRRTKNEND